MIFYHYLSCESAIFVTVGVWEQHLDKFDKALDQGKDCVRRRAGGRKSGPMNYRTPIVVGVDHWPV
jgi:hypothetical protein